VLTHLTRVGTQPAAHTITSRLPLTIDQQDHLTSNPIMMSRKRRCDDVTQWSRRSYASFRWYLSDKLHHFNLPHTHTHTHTNIHSHTHTHHISQRSSCSHLIKCSLIMTCTLTLSGSSSSPSIPFHSISYNKGYVFCSVPVHT
jgi:hypothetical protein